MRDLARNKQQIYYKNFLEKTDITEKDEYGNVLVTGSYEIAYSDLKSFKISISANKGDTTQQMFGNQLDYDRVMITSDMGFDISETSILWIDNANTAKGHNFEVKAIAKSLNVMQIAIKQVS